MNAVSTTSNHKPNPVVKPALEARAAAPPAPDRDRPCEVLLGFDTEFAGDILVYDDGITVDFKGIARHLEGSVLRTRKPADTSPPTRGTCGVYVVYAASRLYTKEMIELIGIGANDRLECLRRVLEVKERN